MMATRTFSRWCRGAAPFPSVSAKVSSDLPNPAQDGSGLKSYGRIADRYDIHSVQRRIALSHLMPRISLALLAAALLSAAVAPTTASATVTRNAALAKAPDIPSVEYPGLQHLHYRYGPISITPGQNTIVFKPTNLKPSVPGYITRFKPNLTYTNGKIPRVDILHLHHGVWLMRGYPTFAAGEEKTITQFPSGFGYRYDPSDGWLINYMLHNLLPNRAQVFITWDIDFLPASAPAAASMTEVKPQWMDVSGLKIYPVFDALKGAGHHGRYTFPDDAKGAQVRNVGPAHEWTVPDDITLVGTAGHLHPGGLYTDLEGARGGTTKELFRSEAKYFEPAGAVSWDVAMTATKPDWRIALDKGDTVKVSAAYDTHNASWYEVMGIMETWYAEGHLPGAVAPFTAPVDWHGVVTHGHLPETDNHGGTGAPILPNAVRMLAGAHIATSDIKDFVYGEGDLSLTASGQKVPTVRRGHSITFRNLDSPAGGSADTAIYHTITACKAPCNRATGIAYPVANGPVTFDSGELGYGPDGATAAANRATWKTPKSLSTGTYTYFCRIHPFMRGSFKVVR